MPETVGESGKASKRNSDVMNTLQENKTKVKQIIAKSSASPMTPEEFREIQKALGLSNRSLAKFLNVAKASIEFWKSGKHPISGPVSMLMRILKSQIDA